MEFTVGGIPVAPTVTAPVGNAGVRPTIDWDDVAGATGYRIYILRLADATVVVNEVVVASEFTPGFDFNHGSHVAWVHAAVRGGSRASPVGFHLDEGVYGCGLLTSHLFRPKVSPDRRRSNGGCPG